MASPARTPSPGFISEAGQALRKSTLLHKCFGLRFELAVEERTRHSNENERGIRRDLAVHRASLRYGRTLPLATAERGEAGSIQSSPVAPEMPLAGPDFSAIPSALPKPDMPV